MTVDSTLVGILVLLMPGLIGRLVFLRLKANRPRTAWQAFVEVFLFAFASYIIAGILLSSTSVSNVPQGRPLSAIVGSQNIEAIYQGTDRIDWAELYLAILVAVAVAVITAWAHNKKLINRFGRWTGITRSFGDEDVWEYIHNSPDIDWVYVRDRLQGLTYYGQVDKYSDSYRPRELALSNVIAYDNVTGERLYALDGAYISRATDETTIEIPLYANHIPDTHSVETFERLKAAANENERRLLRRVYRYSTVSERYELRQKSRAKDRTRLQALLNREGFSVIHRLREKPNDEQHNTE